MGGVYLSPNVPPASPQGHTPFKSRGHGYENCMPMWTKARKKRKLVPMSTPGSLQRNTVLLPTVSRGHTGACTHCAPALPWKTDAQEALIRALSSDTTMGLAPGSTAQTPAALVSFSVGDCKEPRFPSGFTQTIFNEDLLCARPCLWN